MFDSSISKTLSKRKFAFRQLNLFTKKVRSAYLVAWSSPRKAFYHIWIEVADGEYSVVKESGIKGKMLDRRVWPYSNLQEAVKAYQRRIKAKTNLDRKSPRKYQLIKATQKG